MLLGRTSELQYLNEHYEKEENQVVVLYGTGEIGKTALLKKFCEDKPHYFYYARSCSEREQRYQWGKELNQNGITVSRYPEFTEILEKLTEQQDDGMILVIEEFQNLIRLCPHFITELLAFLHDEKKSGRILLILSSSAVGWVENRMIGKLGEAAYEISGLLKLKELKFEDMTSYFPHFSIRQCIETYSILGGFPGLWRYFDDSLSVQENIINTMVKSSGGLHEAARKFVEEDLRELSVYNTILSAIAGGNCKLNDIFLHTEYSRAKISVYLKNLMEPGIVEKVFSVDTEGRENSRKGIYRICNRFVQFYYRFLYPNMTELETESPLVFYEKRIAPGLREYTSGHFREICLQYLEKKNEEGKLPLSFVKCGEWVGKNGTVDIVAEDETGNILVGFCSRGRSIMTYEEYGEYLDLLKQAELDADCIYLFSMEGFDEKLTLEAKVRRNLSTVSFRE